MNHLPGYLKNYELFKAQGVDVIAVIAANDPFVLSGWARVEGLKDKVNNAPPDRMKCCSLWPQIVALSDSGAQWSGSIGLSIDLSTRGLGIRTARYALILEDLVVKHIQVRLCAVCWSYRSCALQVEEVPSNVTVTGAEHLLALL